jgi:hypothetical protein
MSVVLNNVENQCLELLFAFLNDHKCVPSGHCSLIFDGLMIPDTPVIRDKVTGGAFLAEASKYIHQATGYLIEVKVKEFDEAFELPDGYANEISDVFVINPGQDRLAADEFVRRHRDRLIKCKGRVFWEEGGGIFTDDPKRVKDGVLAAVSRMNICMRGKDTLLPYSESVRHAEDCAKFVLADSSLEQPDFVDKLFTSSMRHLAFEDGIYSFETGKLLPYPVAGVYFMHRINRLFPAHVDPAVQKQVMDKVLAPAFPSEEQQNYYLHRLGRALAGDIYDRDSSKGVLCDLISWSFGDFVQTINSENLLNKSATTSGDAAKAQSWMSSLEFKRVALSNEIQLQGGRARYETVLT